MKRFRKYANPPANGHQMLQQLGHAGPEVVKRFMINLVATRGDKGATTYLCNKYANAEQFLSGAFVWDNTPEKGQYWLRVRIDSHAALPWHEWHETYAQK